MTNQGELVNKIMRSGNYHEKEYIVKVDREVTEKFLKDMADGVYLKDLEATTRRCQVEKVGKRTFRIILTQGMNRQIRRMFETCAYPEYQAWRFEDGRVPESNAGRMAGTAKAD